jgi:FkbM family methyltransferase
MRLSKLTPISLVKRITEFALKSYYTNLILKSYQNDKKSLNRIFNAARAFYGIHNSAFTAQNPGARIKRHRSFFNVWDIDFIHQAQIDLFRSNKAAGYHGITLIGFENQRIEWSSNDTNSSEVYLFGFSDNLTWFDIYKKYVHTGTMAIDVGANIGIHTLVLSRCVGDKGAVIAFEPSEIIFKRLLGTIALNGVKNVSALSCGAGEMVSTRRFEPYLTKFNIGQGRIDSNGSSEITLTTIDEQLKNSTLPLSLIKIDTEGYEINVLKGAQESLRKHKPAVVMEFNADSYSFDQFVKLIPYDALCYRIPHSYFEKAKVFNGTSGGCFDVLIVPEK